MKAIAEDLGIDRKTVYNVARRAGLPHWHVFDPERTNRILAAYEDGVSATQIAETEGVHRTYVRDVAKRAGLPPREGWARKYPIDETAFDEPRPVGWWLVGLLAADGCVRTGNLISLAQSERDADVLREFLAYVGSPDRPLTELKLSPGAARRAWPRSAAWEARVWSRHINRLVFERAAAPTVYEHRGGLGSVRLQGRKAACAAKILLASTPVSLRRKRRSLQAIAASATSDGSWTPPRMRTSENNN
jgi:hypothetical protein